MSFASPTIVGTGTNTVWISTGTAATAANTVTLSSAMASALYSSQHLTTATTSPLVLAVKRLLGDCSIADGDACRVRLPDGAVLEVNADGSYHLNDANSKVIYRAHRVREFNSYLNASDKLEDFIKFCGEQGVRQGDVLGLPVQLFIAWLVIEAARADDDPAPDVPLLPQIKREALPRCSCGRFLRRAAKARNLMFCSTRCFEKQMKCLEAA